MNNKSTIIAIYTNILNLAIKLKKVHNLYSFVYTKLSANYNVDVNIQVYLHQNKTM